MPTPPMFVLPFRPAYDSNGRTIPGAQAWFTLTETDTPTPVYVDDTLLTAHPNPLVSDGLGKFPRAFLNPAIVYRCRIYDKDAVVATDDPIEDHDYDPYTPTDQGGQGAQGANATILSPTVPTVTVAPGVPASASTSYLGLGVYQIHLSIPKGDTGASGALSNGTYGDIIVTSAGAVMTVGPAAITNSKLANMAAATVKGRVTGSGAGVPADIAIGAAAATDIIDRAAGDARYIQQAASRVYSLYIPAGAMKPRTTNPPAAGSIETTTNKVNFDTLDFDSVATEYAQFAYGMPKSWDEGTLTAQFIWACGVTGTATWGIQAVAISDDDLLDTAFGAAQTVTDTVTAITDLMQSAFTAAITVAGAPANNDEVIFQIYRTGGTAAGDARLIGVRVNFTVNAQDDS